MDPKELREQAVKDAKCALILDAARKVFTEKGYFNTRQEDIAAAAGFSKPSLYSYYDDKESIFLSLAIREMDDMLDKIEEAIALKNSFQHTLERVLEIIFVSFDKQYMFINTAVGLRNLGSLHTEMTRHGKLELQFEETTARFFMSITKILERAQSSGEILSKLDASTLSLHILCLVQGVQAKALMTGNIGKTEVVVDQILEFINMVSL